MALTDKLTAIADAIRAKTGGTAALTLEQMPTEIAGITGGGSGASQPACEVKVMQIHSEVRYLNQLPLAEIPAEMLAEYPYAAMVVLLNETVVLWLSTEKAYVTTTADGKDKFCVPGNRVYYAFNADANAWVIGYAYTTGSYNYGIHGSDSWAVWWANHDIHIGSADSGEIYFPASHPIQPPTNVTHYCYNGVRLPAIPADVLAQYPYAWIRKHTTNGVYQLMLSASIFYLDGTTLYASDAIINPLYTYPIGDTTETGWTDANNTTYYGWGVDDTRPCIWSNHDIPNGSATATTIYFRASGLRSEKLADVTHYYYNGVRLPAIPDDAKGYPYIFIHDNYLYASTVLPYADGYGLWSAEGTVQAYKYNADTDQWEYKAEYGGFSMGIGNLVWSNFDIPSGRADATDIYFHGTLAVPDPLQGGV